MAWLVYRNRCRIQLYAATNCRNEEERSWAASNPPSSIRRCASGTRDIGAALPLRRNTPIRAITFRFFTTVRAMPSAMRSPSRGQRFQSRQQFRLEVRIVHRHQQLFVAALAHQIANALIHRDSRRGHQRRHGSHDAVIARRCHHVAGSQNADQFIHVVLVGSQNRHSAEFLGDAIGRTRIQPLRRRQNHEHIPLLAECVDRVRNRGPVMFVGAIGRRPRVVEIDGPR